MTKLDDAIQGGVYQPMNNAWHTYMENLFTSMKNMEQTIAEAEEMPMDCTQSWCTNARALLDDINHQIFSIHEPKWSSDEDSDRIRAMRKSIHGIYSRLSGIEEKL